MMSFFGRRSTENCHHHSSYDRPFASRLPVVHSVDCKKSTDLNLPHPYDLHASKNTVQIHFDNAPIALTLTTRVAISIFAFSSWSRSVVIVVGHIDEDEGKGRCSSCKNYRKEMLEFGWHVYFVLVVSSMIVRLGQLLEFLLHHTGN